MIYPVKYFPFKTYDGTHAMPHYHETHEAAAAYLQWIEYVFNERGHIEDRREKQLESL
jgi:hypothetical protein